MIISELIADSLRVCVCVVCVCLCTFLITMDFPLFLVPRFQLSIL